MANIRYGPLEFQKPWQNDTVDQRPIISLLFREPEVTVYIVIWWPSSFCMLCITLLYASYLSYSLLMYFHNIWLEFTTWFVLYFPDFVVKFCMSDSQSTAYDQGMLMYLKNFWLWHLKWCIGSNSSISFHVLPNILLWNYVQCHVRLLTCFHGLSFYAYITSVTLFILFLFLHWCISLFLPVMCSFMAPRHKVILF